MTWEPGFVGTASVGSCVRWPPYSRRRASGSTWDTQPATVSRT